MISGTLQADFSSFSAAVDSAVVKLTDFEANSGKVSSALSKMANSLTGNQIVQQATIMAEAVDRIGGISKLTEAELAKVGATATEAAEKLTALGQTVPPGIQAIADAAKNAGDSFGEWAGKFDIKTAISDPLGTAQGGLSAFADTLGVAGIALTGVASLAVLGGKELFSLAQEAAALGSSVYDASLKMSMTVPAVDALRQSAIVAGGSLEQMSNLVFMMQQRMEQQPTKFNDALQSLKISAADFFALSPDQKLLAISDAMRAAGDSTNLQAVAMELFGRSGRDSLAVLEKPMRDYYDQAVANGVMTADQAKGAEDYGIAVRQLGLEYENLKNTVGNVVLPTLTLATSHFADFAKQVVQGGMGNDQFSESIALMNKGLTEQGILIDYLSGHSWGELPKVMGDATAAEAKWAAGLDTLKQGGQGVIDIVGNIKTATRELEEEDKLAAAAAKKFGDAWYELDSVGATLTDTLATINPKLLEQINYYLSLGQSVKTVAAAYPELSTAQVAAADKMLKLNDSTSLALTQLWADYDKAAGDLMTTDLQRATNAAEAKYEIAVKAAQAKGVVDINYYNALWALREQDVSKASNDDARVAKGSIEALNQEYQKQVQTLNDMMTGRLHYSAAAIQAQRDVVDADKNAAMGLTAIGKAAVDVTPAIVNSTQSWIDQLNAADDAANKVGTDITKAGAAAKAAASSTGFQGAPMELVTDPVTGKQRGESISEIIQQWQFMPGFTLQMAEQIWTTTQNYLKAQTASTLAASATTAVLPAASLTPVPPVLAAPSLASGAGSGGVTVIIQQNGVLGMLDAPSAAKLGQIAGAAVMAQLRTGRQLG
jgi:hypothetical protein